MKNRLLIALLVLWLAMLACGSSAPKTANDYFKEYGGNLDVYNRIMSLSDCADLQKEFDTAYENSLRDAGTPKFKWSEGYMKASDDRMKELGCYDS